MSTFPVALRSLLLAAAASQLGGCGDAADTTSSASPEGVAVLVVTLQPERLTLRRELPGRSEPSMVAEVRPQATGLIESRHFSEGSDVAAGDLLYRLDDARYRADHASARAAVAHAEAALETARQQARRGDQLISRQAISRQDHDNLLAARRQAEADLGVARAELERAAVELGYTRISAPIAGRIGRSSVTQGALVTANQEQALAVIQQLDPIYLDLSQSSRELLQLRQELAVGSLASSAQLPVTVLLEDGSVYAHAGTLAFAEVSVDPGTGSVALRVRVPNPDGLLLPGMYLRAQVANGVRENALLVPQEAVARTPKGAASVWLVNAQGQAEQRALQLGQAIGNRWLVDSGLAAGDRVIVAGLQKVKPGMAVQASEREAAAPPAAAAAQP